MNTNQPAKIDLSIFQNLQIEKAERGVWNDGLQNLDVLNLFLADGSRMMIFIDFELPYVATLNYILYDKNNNVIGKGERSE